MADRPIPTPPERVLVCGGRDYTDRRRVFDVLYSLQPTPLLVIHGDARGADSLAGEWARTNDVLEASYPADWAVHGKAAGSIRNAKMLREAAPQLVIAFPGGRGTADMVQRARAAGIKVLEIDAPTTTEKASRSTPFSRSNNPTYR